MSVRKIENGFPEPVKPERSGSGFDGHGDRETHPAYGAVMVSHTHGSSGPMFGSTLPDNPGYITITLSTAERNLHSGWETHFARDQLFSFTMTHAQFVEMVANPNRGSGVPVTLKSRRKDNGNYEEFPQILADSDATPAAESLRNVRQKGKEIGKKIATVQAEILASLEGKVSKKTLEEVRIKLEVMNGEISSNLPFFVQLVNEAAEKVVSNVRIETEAIVSGIATRLGFRSLSELAKEAHKRLNETSTNAIAGDEDRDL